MLPLLLAVLLLLPSLALAQQNLGNVKVNQLEVTGGANRSIKVPTMTTSERDSFQHQNGEVIDCRDCSPVGGYMFMNGVWVFLGGTGGGTSGGITSLNGLTGTAYPVQFFASDSNVVITSSGGTHSLGWSGCLPVARGGIGACSGVQDRLMYFSSPTSINSSIVAQRFGPGGFVELNINPGVGDQQIITADHDNATGTGTALMVKGGNAQGVDQQGGELNLFGGLPSGTAAGGSVALAGRPGTPGGNVTIGAGLSLGSSNGSFVSIDGGNSTSGHGGDVTVTGGLAPLAGPQRGGHVQINPGTGTPYGDVFINQFTPHGNTYINGLKFPFADGTSGQFIKTDGAGNLSFATVTGSGTVTGTGTTNTLPVFTNGPAGVLGNSLVSQPPGGLELVLTPTTGDLLTLRSSKALVVRAGDGIGTNQPGGGVIVSGGGATGTGEGGFAEMRAAGVIGAGLGGHAYVQAGGGTGTGSGGPASIEGGSVTGSGAGGDAFVTAGSSGSGSGGNVRINSGASNTGPSSTYGNVIINGNIPRGHILLNGMRFPDADGGNGQFITTNGAGVLSWASGTGASGLTSLNTLGAAVQTVAPGTTNVNWSSAGSTHTFTWTGQLSAARGGWGVDTSTWTGIPQVTGGVWALYAGYTCPAGQVLTAISATGVGTCAVGGTGNVTHTGNLTATVPVVGNDLGDVKTMPGYLANAVYYSNAGAGMKQELGFNYFETPHTLAIGTGGTLPGAPAFAFTTPRLFVDSALHIGTVGSLNPTLTFYGNGGTYALPTPTTGGTIGAIDFRGFDGTSSLRGARILTQSSVVPGAIPTSMKLQTADGAGLHDTLTLGSDGNTALGGKIVKYASLTPSNGQLLIGDTTNGAFQLGSLSCSAGVSCSPTAGGISITGSGGGGATTGATGWFNVKDYGVVTGSSIMASTDPIAIANSTAIVGAVNAACTARGVLYFPAGVYTFSGPILIGDGGATDPGGCLGGMTVLGAGASQTPDGDTPDPPLSGSVVRGTFTNAIFSVNTRGAVNFERLAIAQGNTTPGAAGINIGGPGGTAGNGGSKLTNVRVSGGDFGVRTFRSAHLIVDTIFVDLFKTAGISIESTQNCDNNQTTIVNARIEGNNFANSQSYGIINKGGAFTLTSSEIFNVATGVMQQSGVGACSHTLTATTTAALAPGATTITVNSTASFPVLGSLVIGGTTVNYTSIDASHFLGVTGVTASYATGTTVTNASPGLPQVVISGNQIVASTTNLGGGSSIALYALNQNGMSGVSITGNLLIPFTTGWGVTFNSDGSPGTIFASVVISGNTIGYNSGIAGGVRLWNCVGCLITGNIYDGSDVQAPFIDSAGGNTRTTVSNTQFVRGAGAAYRNADYSVEQGHPGVSFGNLPSSANASRIFCPDCLLGSNPCAGGGTGAVANRLASAWTCGSGGIAGSGTVNRLPVWTGTTTLGNSLIGQDAASNTVIVGPGTTDPSSRQITADTMPGGSGLSLIVHGGDAASGSGGGLNLRGGSSTTGNSGGSASLTGTPGAPGGNVTLSAGQSTGTGSAAIGGFIGLSAGNASTAAAGDIFLTGGLNSGAFRGGNVYLNGGTGTPYGDILLQSGTPHGEIILNGMKFPHSDGPSGQFIKTDGAGNLSFGVPPSGGTPGAPNGSVQYNNNGAFGGATRIVYADAFPGGDRAKIQAAIDAVTSSGTVAGTVLLACRTYSLDNLPITISGAAGLNVGVTLRGCGTKGATKLVAGTSGVVIQVNANASGTRFENMTIQPITSGTAIFMQDCQACRVTDVEFIGPMFTGLAALRVSQLVVDRVAMLFYSSAGISIAATIESVDAGDNTIVNSTFFSNPNSDGTLGAPPPCTICWGGGGGLRILNNKFLGWLANGGAIIDIHSTVGDTGDFNISNNSFEWGSKDFLGYGIRVRANGGTTLPPDPPTVWPTSAGSYIGAFTFTGNQFTTSYYKTPISFEGNTVLRTWCPTGCVNVHSIAIAGNLLNMQGAGNGVYANNVNRVAITGNMIAGIAGSAGVNLGTATAVCAMANTFDGGTAKYVGTSPTSGC